MPQPIICLDEEVRHFAERFRSLFSKPQYQYFVTVLLGLMECEGRRTLSGVLREVGQSSQSEWAESVSRGSPVVARSGGGQLAEALSHRDAAAGCSRTGTAVTAATQASRPSQTAPRDRVCDRGRFDDEQTERTQDGRIGQAPLDHL